LAASVDVGPNFPMEPGQNVSPGPVEIKGEAFVTVRSLKSLEKDGKPYSDAMDNIMYEKLNAETAPNYVQGDRVDAQEAAKTKEDPYTFDARAKSPSWCQQGRPMPVTVLPMADKRIKISGSVPLKMTTSN